MAGTQAPRRKKRAKQKRLDGIEVDDSIREVEDAAEEYIDRRDERMVLTTKEVEAKETLIKVMHKHKKDVYRSNGLSITLTHKESDDVKVTKISDQDGEKDFGGE